MSKRVSGNLPRLMEGVARLSSSITRSNSRRIACYDFPGCAYLSLICTRLCAVNRGCSNDVC